MTKASVLLLFLPILCRGQEEGSGLEGGLEVSYEDAFGDKDFSEEDAFGDKEYPEEDVLEDKEYSEEDTVEVLVEERGQCEYR